MASSSHLMALLAKHKELEQQIEREIARPSPDGFRVSHLKKQKLRLKESMARVVIDVGVPA